MKTIFRFLGLAVVTTVFSVAGSTSIFAQDAPAAGPCDNVEAGAPLYEIFRAHYADKTPEGRQQAVTAGEEYIKKFGTCEWAKDQVTYLNSYLPPAKEWITKEFDRLKLAALFTRFDNATKAGNWDEVYSAGKEILAKDPDNMNILITLGSIGLDETLKTPRNLKYNDDTLRYAKSAIQKLNEGKTSKNLGVFQFAYKTKENALGWLNYTIGAITYYGQNNKKEALPYLYKSATQNGADTKNLAQVYGIIGDYYYDEVARLGQEIAAKFAASQNKDTDETKALIAQQKAYSERGMDAYARAAKLVDATKGAKYKDSLTAQAEALYKIRFQKTEGAKPFIDSLVAKQTFPDPVTVPTPIVEADPADTPKPGTAAPGTTNPGTKPVTPSTNGTKPAAAAAPGNNGTKPATTAPSTTRKPVSANTTGSSTSTAKAAAKKPVAKKKGTR